MITRPISETTSRDLTYFELTLASDALLPKVSVCPAACDSFGDTELKREPHISLVSPLLSPICFVLK